MLVRNPLRLLAWLSEICFMQAWKPATFKQKPVAKQNVNGNEKQKKQEHITHPKDYTITP